MRIIRQPSALLIALVIFFAYIVTLLGLSLLQTGGQPIDIVGLISKRVSLSLIVITIGLVAIVAVLGWWSRVGLAFPLQNSDWKYALVPAAAVGLIVLCGLVGRIVLEAQSGSGRNFAGSLVIVALNTLLVGISEELMFRGILFYGFESRFGGLRALLITSILFGLLHASNGLVTGNYVAASAQAFGNIFAGFWFGALRWRMGSVLPGMVLHWLWDFGLLVLAGGVPAGTEVPELSLLQQFGLPLIAQLPLFLYGLLLVRSMRRLPSMRAAA